MENEKLTKAIDIYRELSFEDKKSLYLSELDIGRIGDTPDDLFILISLTLLTYLKLKEKDQSVTALSILQKIGGQKSDDSYFFRSLENLSILVETLSLYYKKPNSCGLTDSKQVINKIKELLNTWTPF